MRHVNLDREPKRVKELVQELSSGNVGTVLKLNGKPVARIIPIAKRSQARLKAAILRRRDESRRLNAEWAAADAALADAAKE